MGTLRNAYIHFVFLEPRVDVTLQNFKTRISARREIRKKIMEKISRDDLEMVHHPCEFEKICSRIAEYRNL